MNGLKIKTKRGSCKCSCLFYIPLQNMIHIKLRRNDEQEKALRARLNQQERKARTKRLIEAGAVAENILGTPIEKKDLSKFQNLVEIGKAVIHYAGNITNIEAFKEYLEQYGYAIARTQKNKAPQD